MLTDDASYIIPYDLSEYKEEYGKPLRIGGSFFSNSGISLNINRSEISLNGNLKYQNLTPIKGDIMGPFQFFPMECRHGIVSMKHAVSGEVILNGAKLDFSGGTGYIETDSGFSFPEGYTWIQCNDFKEDCSIMAAVAKIPFAGLSFWGCICVIWLNGREYRLATYRGVKIIRCTHNVIELKQGKYHLTINASQSNSHKLVAPKSGIMSRTIKESASCPAEFLFTENGKTLFAGNSNCASYEYVME